MASVSMAARESLLLLDHVAGEHEGEVAGGAEGPFPGDPDEVDAAPGIELAQVLQDRLDVGAFRQAAGQLLGAQGLRRGEQQRLGDAHGLAVVRDVAGLGLIGLGRID